MGCDKCKEFMAHLSEYVDHELEDDICSCIDEHILECDECRELIETFKKTIDAAHHIEKKELPDDFRDKILKNFKHCIKDLKI